MGAFYVAVVLVTPTVSLEPWAHVYSIAIVAFLAILQVSFFEWAVAS